MLIVISALATPHAGDRLIWLIVPAACAVAAVAGTIYRNYFADINGQTRWSR